MKKIGPWCYAFIILITLMIILILAYCKIANINKFVNAFLKINNGTIHTYRITKKSASLVDKGVFKNKKMGITPNAGSASGGNHVMIQGKHLNHALAVAIGGNTAKIIKDKHNRIIAIAPSNNGYPATVDVDVTTANENTITVGKYQYKLLPPSISNILPTTGATAGGNIVTIKGNNLLNATRVSFDGIDGKIIANKANLITVKTPLHIQSGSVDVYVGTMSGSTLLKNGYYYR